MDPTSAEEAEFLDLGRTALAARRDWGKGKGQGKGEGKSQGNGQGKGEGKNKGKRKGQSKGKNKGLSPEVICPPQEWKEYICQRSISQKNIQ